MAISVGDAVLKLGVDTKDLEKGMKGLKGKLQQHSRAIGMGMAAMGGAIVAAGILSIKTFAEMGDEVAKMALRTGFSTEALSELRHAAEISGASLGTLEKGVKKMAMSISDARDGLMTYTREFDKIGISVQDLQDLNPEEQFFAIAEAIASLEDPTQRAASAQKILGRAGTELLPLFAEGREGMAKLRREAHELGIVFDQEAANKAAKMTDAMHRLDESMKGVKFAIAERLIPILTPLIDKIRDIISKVSNWMREHEGLSRAIVIGTTAVGLLLIPLGFLLIMLPTLIGLYKTLISSTIGHKIAIWGQTAAVWLLNTSLAAAIVLIAGLTLGLSLLIVGIVGLIARTKEQTDATHGLKEEMGASAKVTAENVDWFRLLDDGLMATVKASDSMTKAVEREKEAQKELRLELWRQVEARSALMQGLRQAAMIVGAPTVIKALQEAGEIGFGPGRRMPAKRVTPRTRIGPRLPGPVMGMQFGGIAMRPITARIAEKRPEAVIPLDRLAGLGGYKTANIYFSIGEREFARITGQTLVDELRLYGVRL